MSRFVAFLRAVNVGGRTVRMEVLRREFERLGAADVETFIASGNVVFQTPRRNVRSLEQEIEAHLLDAMGFPVTTFLRSVPELATIAAHQPFPKAELQRGARLFVGLMKEPPGTGADRAIEALRSDADDFVLHGRELYWLRRAQMMQAIASGPRIEKSLGTPLTMRNVNTIQRLAAKYCN